MITSKVKESAEQNPRHVFVFNRLTIGMNRLRGQLLNLADVTAGNSEQRESLKGLIKDFTFEFWEEMAQAIDAGFYSKEELMLEPTEQLKDGSGRIN